MDCAQLKELAQVRSNCCQWKWKPVCSITERMEALVKCSSWR